MKISDPVFDQTVSLREAYRIMEKFVHAHFERGETTTFELFSYLSLAPDETSSDPAAFADFLSAAETVMKSGSRPSINGTSSPAF